MYVCAYAVERVAVIPVRPGSVAILANGRREDDAHDKHVKGDQSKEPDKAMQRLEQATQERPEILILIRIVILLLTIMIIIQIMSITITITITKTIAISIILLIIMIIAICVHIYIYICTY